MGEQQLPEDLESMTPGPELATLLASVDRAKLSGGDRLRLAQARNRLASHVQAQLMQDLYAVTWQEPPPDERVAPEQASRYPWSEVEVAFALRWTRTAAGAQLEQARQPVEDLPATARLVDKIIDKAARWTTGQQPRRHREVWGRSLPPQDVAAVRERLTAIARAAKAPATRAACDSYAPTPSWTS